MADTGVWLRIICPDTTITQVRLEVYDENSSSDQPLATSFVPESPLSNSRPFLEISTTEENTLWLLILTDPDLINHIRLEAVGLTYGDRVAYGNLGNVRFEKNKIVEHRDPLKLTWTGNDWLPDLNVIGGWELGRANASGDVGEYSALAIDRSGQFHISHYDNFSEALKYTTNSSGVWETTTLAKNLPRGSVLCTSLAVDGNSHIHICYQDYPNLRYVTNASGEWRFNSITDGGKENAIAVDKSGHVHIAFTRRGELFYLKNRSGNFIYQSVDRRHVGFQVSDALGRHISIAVDAVSCPHISYYNHDSKSLRYATKTNGSWKKSTLVRDRDRGDLGTYNAITVDHSGHIHISYHSRISDECGDLCYITNTGEEWDIDWVEVSPREADGYRRVGVYSAIAVDAHGHAHVAYESRAALPSVVKYATNRSGTWKSETIDESGTTAGKNAAIAVDGSGYIYLCYRWHKKPYGSELRYATTAPAHTAIAVVDWDEDVGKYSSIAIDNEQGHHISYYDESNAMLKYATIAAGDENWQKEPVDAATNVGKFTSVVVDGSGRVHISYLDTMNSDLKYVSRMPGGMWEFETVDQGPVASSNTTLVVDQSGRVHISYTGLQANNHACLKYVTRAAGSSNWEAQTVDSEGWVGANSAISVDSLGVVHLCYRGNPNQALKYAMRAAGDSQWRMKRVAEGVSGRATSICQDATGRLYISYYQYHNGVGNIMLATRGADEDNWENRFVDYGGNVGEYNAIAVDPSNHLHIAYSDNKHGDLKYATYMRGIMTGIQVLDSTGRVGTHPAIAVDTSGHVAISYYDTFCRNLKCARPLFVGLYCFSAYGHPGYYIRHRYWLGELSTVVSDLDRADATFRLVPGLANSGYGYVSFEAVNYPGHFLRHQHMRLKLHEFAEEQLYRNDATFRIKRGLADSRGVSFESLNFPGFFVCHKAESADYTLNIVDSETLVEEHRVGDATFMKTGALFSVP